MRQYRKYKLFGPVIIIVLLGFSMVFSNSLPLARSELVQNQKAPCIIATYGNAWNGELTFGLMQNSPANGPTGNYVLVMNSTDGTINYLRQSIQTSFADQGYEIVKNIAPGTLMFTGEHYVGGPFMAPLFPVHFWNYLNNTVQDFPNVTGHHDMEYNPINNTFLTLQDYVRSVNGNPTLFDKIVELDANGNVLWTWDTYNYLPLNESDPYNPTAFVNGQIVSDFTHTNALDWDYNNSIIYLNVRNLNTFYKIDQNTGNIIWACGQFGNFTLLDSQDNKVNSLWYHSHGTLQVAPNVFEMLDNDFDNVTNPNNCRSEMIEVTLNEQTMTARTSWSWEAPQSYWCPSFGDSLRLPNGDRIGCFGDQTHQYAQNAQYTSGDTGAILAEINPQGELVRTYTFPVGYAIYRVQQIMYPSATISTPSPTPEPTSTPSPTSTPTPTPTSTPMPTSSPTPTPTLTPSPTPEPVSTPSPTPSTTATPALTPTSTPISTPSPTLEPTSTPASPPTPITTSTTSEKPSPIPTQTSTVASTPTTSNQTFSLAAMGQYFSIIVAVIILCAVISGLFIQRKKRRSVTLLN